MDEGLEKNTISVETEWKRVDRLLTSKEDAAWAMAVLEAFKIFHQVLSEVSFGETTEDKIHNAGELFKDVRSVLAAEKICRHILEDVGHKVSRADATKATAALLQAILDMIGRDWQERGWWDRWMAGLNYFWGTHPRVLPGILVGLLAVILLTWFLADTAVGRWVVNLVVGFAHFMIGQPVLIGALLIAIVISSLLGLTFSSRRRRP